MTNKSNFIGNLSINYSNKPVLRSLLQLIPNWGAADELLQYRANEIKNERLATFFDELAEGKHELTAELIKTEDFLHCYFSTLRAALNTRQREKIRFLARLLDASFSPDIHTTTDEYEELLSVLESITLREFEVLFDLWSLEQQYPRSNQENDLENAWHYWEKFKANSTTKYEISTEGFSAFMAKLERTGLYLRITGGYIGYEGDIGMTTPMFDRLLIFVRRTDAQSGSRGFFSPSPHTTRHAGPHRAVR